MTQQYLATTAMLDFQSPDFLALEELHKWQKYSDFEKIGHAYHFVKDKILFGYNRRDDIAASEVLRDGYGQCNTKSTLLMALLRALGIACRFHGFTIHKPLQKGAIPNYLYPLTPDKILHSWVEVYYQGDWVALEGVILDERYLQGIRSQFPEQQGAFCGYGIATSCLSEPKVQWQGQSTYIQRMGIADDFGIFDSPDAFYQQYGVNLSGLKGWCYEYIIRHLINRNVARYRR